MLVESVSDPAVILQELNSQETTYHYAPSIGCEKVVLFARFSSDFLRPILETNRLTVRHLNLPGVTDILLAVTHFPSKLHWSDTSQMMECVELSNSIRVAESQVGHSRTVLVGDLNMNPFEGGVVSANGLHGVASRAIAQKKSRIIQSREYPFFYNPMWVLFGDGTRRPPGTYYYSSSEHCVYFWNLFDQVLLRPDLIHRFEMDALDILKSDGDKSFLTEDGLPDVAMASDHLPLFFRISL
jgi:hypothetical protein